MVHPGAASNPTPTIAQIAACHRRMVRSSLTRRAFLQFARPRNPPVDRAWAMSGDPSGPVAAQRSPHRLRTAVRVPSLPPRPPMAAPRVLLALQTSWDPGGRTLQGAVSVAGQGESHGTTTCRPMAMRPKANWRSTRGTEHRSISPSWAAYL
jgi:hypothetical protein